MKKSLIKLKSSKLLRREKMNMKKILKEHYKEKIASVISRMEETVLFSVRIS